MAEVAPSRKNRKSLTVWIEPDLVKDVKRLALERDRTVQDIVESALRKCVRAGKGKAQEPA